MQKKKKNVFKYKFDKRVVVFGELELVVYVFQSTIAEFNGGHPIV
jgi:hypothetical protein